MAERGQISGEGEEEDDHQIRKRKVAKLKPPSEMTESESHHLGPLTINTELLDSFGLGPKYTELQPIGFGVHGLVVSALDRVKKQRVAAKKIKIESQISCKYALREVRTMCQMKHDNVVEVLEVLLDDGSQQGATSKNQESSKINQLYIITELLDTNLNVLITQKLIESEHVKLITYQLLRGLHYLKSANVVHRDLKPSNLFINCDTLLLKIGDFGLARIIDPMYNHSGHLTADLGTYWYRAPEQMLSPRSYSAAMDMWSAGCIIGEMLLGHPVFTGATEYDQLRHIIDSVQLTERDWSAVLHVLPNRLLHQHPLTPQRPLAHRLDDVDSMVVDLLENLLVFDAPQRMSPGEALNHPYLQLYAKPDREPVAVNPFGIEAEVDDLPIEILKNIILEERNCKRGNRGLFFPVPSPIDRPKVSSATLSLKPVGDTTQPKVPLSPTFDNIIQEQRRNRRNKISTSVDLSFISLPSSQQAEKPPTPPPEEQQPQKVVYSTSNFPAKQNTPPCPWKWPEVKAVEERKSESSSSGSFASAVSSPASAVSTPASAVSSPASAKSITGSMEKESEALIFKHTPTDPRIHKKEAALVKEERHTASRGSPGRREPKGPREDGGIRIGRMKPKKRGFVDVGGFDEEDYIHLGINPETDAARRHSTDALGLGRIESYQEKDQARIDRELNRKNRTASMDLSYISVPNLQYGLAPTVLTTSSAIIPNTSSSSIVTAPSSSTITAPSSSKVPPSSSLTAPTSFVNEGRIIPEVIMRCKPPSPSGVSSPLTSRKNRSSDVGIRIIKSPKPVRKAPPPPAPSTSAATTTSAYYLHPETTPPTERRRSTAYIECSSPIPLPERKISVTSLESTSSSQVPTRPPSVSDEDARRGSCTSFLSISPMKPAQQFGAPGSQSCTVPYSGASSVLFDKNSAKSPQVIRRSRIGTTTPTEPKTLPDSNAIDAGSYDENSGNFSFAERAAAVYSSSSNYADDLPERPSSVVSTLTIPPLSPLPDNAYPNDVAPPPKRNISQTTLFLDNGSAEKEPEGKSYPKDSYTSADQPRSSSSLSVDLSFANKEQQKGEEEEKDTVEVSPRKLQEDWEIESQSSQAEKSEWTLSEILGVSEEDLHGGPSNEVTRPASVTDSVSASPMRGRTPGSLPREPGTYRVSTTKIDLIPYRVLTPDEVKKQQQPEALVMRPERRPAEKIPNNDFEEATAKLEDLTLDLDRKFTTEFFLGSAAGSGLKPTEKAQEPTGHFMEKSKDQLHLDLKNPYPHKLPACLSETPSASALARFGQYKSEEDLTSPRSHSPRDALGAKAMPREVPDLSEFKQSVKENLSSLKVSIPKDFPEKRRLIKAHSTESVCSEGESSSSVKGHEHGVTDRGSTEDLIQFSPVGGGSGTNNKVDPWSAHGAHKDDHQSQGSGCNHCLYQGDCKSATCRDMLGRMEDLTTKDLPLSHQPIATHKPDLYYDYHAAGQPGELEGEEASRTGAALRSSGVRSSLDELCHSKDVFNERQKLMGGMYGDQDPSATSQTDGAVRPVRRKVRPKSAKN